MFCRDKRATLKTYNFFAAEQAFLPVHDKGQTEMSDPPDLINHNGRSLMKRIPISSVPLEFLQKLFGERGDELMYYCYKLDKDKAMALQTFINKLIDLEHYDFYLDCHLSV